MRQLLVMASMALFLTTCGDGSDVSSEPTIQGKETSATVPSFYYGFDMEGNYRRCPPPPQGIMCTMVFGPEEEYRDRCNNAGYKVYMCDCHDYLCSRKIRLENQD